MRPKSVQFRLARTLSSVIHAASRRTMFWKLACYLGLGTSLVGFVGLSASLTAPLLVCMYLVTGGYRFAWVVFKTLPRDLKAIGSLLCVKILVRYYIKTKATIATVFRNTAKRNPNKTMFLYEDTRWTFQDVEDYSNAIANYFLAAGYHKGDVIIIFMEGRPEFPCFWLGLSKIGVISALINFNLRNDSLEHCIQVSTAKAIIFGGELTEAINDVMPKLDQNLKLYRSGSSPGGDLPSVSLDDALRSSPISPPPAITQNFQDHLFYVYTSGTTGLPKAAVISHTRYFYMAYILGYVYKITDRDILYDCLPLYHTSGGILGVGQAILFGTTVVIKRKFSASRFWDDCVRYKCTCAQYIGEICRYLLAQPYRPAETQHTVRMMYGNGLRPQIWSKFQQRFGIKIIGEFYGATEGNANIANVDNHVGSVGFLTQIAPFLYPVALIKVDEDTGEPIRDSRGLCIMAGPGEPGELVGKIIKGDPMREFDGYTTKKNTEKKLCRNVFTQGDLAFLTGDVMETDELGYVYFKDRTGDTFRWRGENVSTAEVEGVISNIIKLKDCVVYGVEVEGIEGRAGMAAILDENQNLDLHDFTASLQRGLPSFARPVFIRLLSNMDQTSTFKLKKLSYKKNGFDPANTSDKLFYMNPMAKEYQPITNQVYQQIQAGKIRL